MPFVPSKQHHKMKRTVAKFDSEELLLWYRPSKVTPAAFDRMSNIAADIQSDDDDPEKNREKINGLVVMIVDFLADWDVAEPVYATYEDGNILTDEQGDPVQKRGADGNLVWDKWPVDHAHVAQLSFGWLNAIIGAIGDDLKPGESTAGGSLVG